MRGLRAAASVRRAATTAVRALSADGGRRCGTSRPSTAADSSPRDAARARRSDPATRTRSVGRRCARRRVAAAPGGARSLLRRRAGSPLGGGGCREVFAAPPAQEEQRRVVLVDGCQHRVSRNDAAYGLGGSANRAIPSLVGHRELLDAGAGAGARQLAVEADEQGPRMNVLAIVVASGDGREQRGRFTTAQEARSQAESGRGERAGSRAVTSNEGLSRRQQGLRRERSVRTALERSRDRRPVLDEECLDRDDVSPEPDTVRRGDCGEGRGMNAVTRDVSCREREVADSSRPQPHFPVLAAAPERAQVAANAIVELTLTMTVGALT